MKNFLSFLIAFFALQNSFSQTLSSIVKQHNGVHYERLAMIDSVLKNYESKNWLVGAVVILVKKNQVVYYKGSGYSNLATKKPMQADAIFRIMSQTKAITSLGIMQLLEQGS